MPWHLARLLQGLAALQLAKQHGVEMAFGSDLLGDLHGAQLREFELRSRVLPPKVGRSRGGGAVFLGSRFTPNTSTQSRLGAGAAGGLQQGGGGGACDVGHMRQAGSDSGGLAASCGLSPLHCWPDLQQSSPAAVHTHHRLP